MILYFVVIVALAGILGAPAWWSARKRNVWFTWDYATVVGPFTLWMLLMGLGVGAQSLSNLIEVVVLLGLVPLALTIRVFALDRWTQVPQRNSIGIFAVCTGVALALRLTMPLIPE